MCLQASFFVSLMSSTVVPLPAARVLDPLGSINFSRSSYERFAMALGQDGSKYQLCTVVQCRFCLWKYIQYTDP